MKKGIIILLAMSVVIGGMLFVFSGKSSKKNSHHINTGKKTEADHHLNIPEAGIEAVMEANSQKIIEGTDGSVIIIVGDVRRKQADISVKRDDKILDERIIGESDKMPFDYDGVTYTVEVQKLKKPLLGAGKAEIRIR